jgi:hypothetical protein
MIKNINVIFKKPVKGIKRKKTKKAPKDSPFKKQSIFFRYIPYWKEFKICHAIDTKHIEKGVEKPSGQYLSLICDESLTCRGLNLNPRHIGSLTFILVSCVVCTMYMETISTCFLVESQNQGRWFSGLRLKTSNSSLVIWVSKSSQRVFLVEPQNQGRRFSGLGLKTGRSGLVTWVSKSLR